MKTFTGYLTEESRKALLAQIGQELISYQFADVRENGSETFDTLGLAFADCNVRLSCSCDNYSGIGEKPGVYADIAVFKAESLGTAKVESPLGNTDMTSVDVGEKLTGVKLFNETIVEEDRKSEHTRGLLLCFETKRLAIWKDIAWGDFLHLAVVDANWEIPASDEQNAGISESFEVTTSVEILK